MGAEYVIGGDSPGLSSLATRGQNSATSLSFLYLGFVRILELLEVKSTKISIAPRMVRKLNSETHAASSYSWISPPSRSRRRTCSRSECEGCQDVAADTKDGNVGAGVSWDIP